MTRETQQAREIAVQFFFGHIALGFRGLGEFHAVYRRPSQVATSPTGAPLHMPAFSALYLKDG